MVRFPCLVQSSGRSGRFMLPPFQVGGIKTVFPSPVVAMPPPLMDINGIIPVTSGMGRKPGEYASSIIPGGIIITEIVVVISGTPKQTVRKHPQINHK